MRPSPLRYFRRRSAKVQPAAAADSDVAMVPDASGGAAAAPADRAAVGKKRRKAASPAAPRGRPRQASVNFAPLPGAASSPPGPQQQQQQAAVRRSPFREALASAAAGALGLARSLGRPATRAAQQHYEPEARALSQYGPAMRAACRVFST